MVRHAYLLHTAIHMADVVMMTAFDMIQSEAIILQNPDNIVECPVEYPLGHTRLHTSDSVILHLNWRRDGFI